MLRKTRPVFTLLQEEDRGPPKVPAEKHRLPLPLNQLLVSGRRHSICRKLANQVRSEVSRREPQLSAGVASTEAQKPLTLFEELFPQRIFTESTASLSTVGGTRSDPAHSAAASTWQERNQSPVDPQLQPCQELQLYV